MLGRMVEIKDMLGNHQIIRADGRKVDELRPVRITRHFTDAPEGSVLIECGNTRVMCTATFTPGVPRWRKDSGLGWVPPAIRSNPRCGRVPPPNAPTVNPYVAKSVAVPTKSAD